MVAKKVLIRDGVAFLRFEDSSKDRVKSFKLRELLQVERLEHQTMFDTEEGYIFIPGIEIYEEFWEELSNEKTIH